MTILKEPTILNVEQLCKRFGCTRAQLAKQYRGNSEDSVRLADKAIRTGKKVCGLRAGQLVVMAIQSDYLAHNALTGK